MEPVVDDVLVVEFLDAVPVPADGATDLRIRVSGVSDDAEPGKEVTLAATRGRFRSTEKSAVTVKLDVDRTALARLVAPTDTSAAELTVTTGDFVLRRPVPFEWAWPSRLTLRSDKFAAKASPTDVVTVTAQLVRESGVPTPGTSVRFTAEDDSGRDIGTLQAPSPSDDKGMATVRFAVGTTTYRGDVVLRASIDVGTEEVAAELRIPVIDP